MKRLYFTSTILTLLLVFGCGGITPKKKEKKPESDREFLKLTDREMNAIKISLEPGVEICGCIKTSSKDFEAVWATACAWSWDKNGLTDIGVWAIGKNAGFYSVTHYTTLISDWGLREDIFLSDDGFEKSIVNEDGFQEVYDYAKDMMVLCK